MQIEPDVKLDYNSVLLRPKRSNLSSRKDTILTRKFQHSQFPDCIPIIAANMDGVGTFEMCEKLAEQNILTCLSKHYSIAELVDFFKINKAYRHAIYSMGVSDDDLAKFRAVNGEITLRMVCIDVANGYSQRFVDFCKKFKENYPNILLIAGNVVSGNITEELLLNGVDVVKVGIGSSGVCTTRLQTGVGYPQLSAVMECADAAHGLNGLVIADGGCTVPGDVVKAFAGGADLVMLGSMLAGHDEGGGEIISKSYQTRELSPDRINFLYEEKKFVQFYGMSSKLANDQHSGGLKEYRSSEGREVLVPYRGPIVDTVNDLLGGIRSAMTYIGASELEYIPKCATFVKCNDTHNRYFEG